MKLSDIYGYGTPSNRFVRPQSQRTENYDDPIDERHEQEAEERAMAQAMGDESEYEKPMEHKYEIQEYGIALYEFDDLQEAVKGLAELKERNGCTWDSDRFKIKHVS